jgi:Beta-galactosidase/beta-glucuronidase
MGIFPHAVKAAGGLNENCATNPSFEEVNGNIPTGWQAINTWGTNQTRLTDETAYSGKYSVVIEPNSATGAPWVAQMIEVTGGATYDLSAWIKSNYIAGSGAYFKVEFYNEMQESSQTYVSAYSSPFVGKSDITGNWQNISCQVNVPADAKAAKVYIRVIGLGKVYWDDVSFKLVKYPPMIALSTDEVFYYTDMTQGRVKAEITPFDGIFENKSVDVRIFKKSTGEILKEGLGLPAQKEITFDFDPSAMSLQDEYTVEVSLKTSEGILEVQKTRIFRWEKPLALNSKNEYTIDGKPFFPVIMYHANTSQYALVKEIGVNTVQGAASIDANQIKDYLDKAQENGLKVIVSLYAGMKVKENLEYTRNTVTMLKDHPAVLAWAVMDEPGQRGDAILDELVEAYRTVRSIDPVHPVYMVECIPSFFEKTGNDTDVLVTDSYPLSKSTSDISTVSEYVAGAKAAVSNKPVWTILQTFCVPPNYPYLPTIDEVRNMAYQAIIEGSQGLGYYSMNDPGWSLSDSELWPGLVKFGDELKCISDFTTGGKMINQFKSDKVQWAIWEKDSELYMAALNLTTEQQNITVPLNINGYKAELLYGERADSFGSLDSELPVQLEAHQAFLYKITPFSSLAEKAEDTLTNAKSIIQDQHWNAQIDMLTKKLHTVKNELISEKPNMKKVLDDSANILRDLSHLEEWVNKQSNLEDKKNDLTNALSQAEKSVDDIMKSLVQLDFEMSDIKVVGGEQVQVNIKIKNNGCQDITNAQLSLGFPEELGLQNVVRPVSKIKHAETIEESFYFNVPADVPLGTYQINTDFDFTHHDVPIVASENRSFEIANIIDASLEPAEIQVKEKGDYNVTLQITNNASEPVNAVLDVSLPEGMSMNILKQITVGPDETQDIGGVLNVSDSVSNGSYQVWIEIKVNEKIVSRLPIEVKVDNNLVFNPGFEEDTNKDNIPDGWMMRKGVWVQDTVKSGGHAVSLLPDNNNLMNVINTDPGKRIEVISGTAYLLHVWAKNASTTGGVSVGVREVKADGTTMKYNWVKVQKNSDWMQYELKWTPTANTKYLEVYLQVDQLINGPAWFDDIRLERSI